MTITAKIIEDSIVDPKALYSAPRLTTFALKYPRFIHSELMTHRTFSRNASSSRAIPVETMIKNILEDTAMPSHWGKNQPGMQADEENSTLINLPANNSEVGGYLGETPEDAWLIARNNAIIVAQAFHEAGYHKQVVNRILEPFMHIEVLVTSTEAGLANFFHLRRHKDAQPEIKILADVMWEEYCKNSPTVLVPGQWHLPYVGPHERENFPANILVKISTARCARVSYLTHDGKIPDVTKDISLYDRLVGGDVIHASPTEHQAMVYLGDNSPCGNLQSGWAQHRKTLSREFIQTYSGEE